MIAFNKSSRPVSTVVLAGLVALCGHVGLSSVPVASASPIPPAAVVSELPPLPGAGVVDMLGPVAAAISEAEATAVSVMVDDAVAPASPSTVSVAAAKTLVAPAVLSPRAGPTWDRALLERQSPVGGNEGAPFSLVGRAGAVVTKVQFFRHNDGAEKYLRGIRVFFSDDTELVAGSEESRYQEFDLPAGSAVSRFSLSAWHHAKNKRTRVGRVQIGLTTGASFSFGLDEDAASTDVPMRVGSGVLVGFEGRAGLDLDQLAPVFLKKIDRSEIENVEVEPFDPSSGLRLVTLDADHAVWNGTAYTYHFSGSTTSSSSTSWSSSFSQDLGVTTKFVANWVPQIVSTEMSASWGFGASQSTSMSESSSKTLSWAVDRDMKGPEDEAICEAQVWEGRLDLRWEGVHTLTTRDGYTSSFLTRGTVKRVAVGKVTHVCRPIRHMPAELRAQLLAKVALYHPRV
ncbi:hypothetical protein VTK26DRAFT_3982 [Humicola hyalothermophila]